MQTLLDFLIAFLSTGLFDDITELLGGSPSSEYPEVWEGLVSGATSIFNSIILPIGIGICTIYFLIGLMEKVAVEQLNLEQFIKQFIKLLIVLYLCQNTVKLVTGLMDFGQGLFQKISPLIQGSGSAGASSFYENLEGYDGNFFDQFALAMQLIVPALFSFAMRIIVGFVCYSRLIEIYLKAMFTPIAVSDIFVGGLNSNGFRYLKSFLALCLQSVVILGITYIYSIVYAGILDGLSADSSLGEYMIATLSINLAATGLLVKSLQLSKEIVGA